MGWSCRRNIRARPVRPNPKNGTSGERELRRGLGHAAEVGLGADAAVGVLGAPFRTGAAHVVPLGAVAGQQFRTHGAPEVGDGLADAWGFVLLGHDTFPSSRRVPTAGSAFWSRRISAWFSDTMRPNWLKFVTTSPAPSPCFANIVSEVLPPPQT